MNKDSEVTDTGVSGEWYNNKGSCTDVVLSTRVRLARNLADFPFPDKFRADDSGRVQTLVFDAFSKGKGADCYQTIAVPSLQFLGARMLLERGLVKNSTLKSPGAGVIMRIKGKKANSGLVCTVNDTDHVRVSCFVPGLNCEKAFNTCCEIDEKLQKNLQFAASYDFGYLTTAVKDSGSGMKLSARVHLPSTSFTGMIPQLFESLAAKGIVAGPAFGQTQGTGASLGNFYQLSSNTSGIETEIEQIAFFKSSLKSVIETERKNNDIVLQKRTTEAEDLIYKSYAVSRYSLLLNLRESIQIISNIKWGKNLGIITDIEDSELTALSYKIQDAHLRSALKTGEFNFPIDIADDENKKVSRLRALMIQDVFEHIKITQ